MKTQIYRKPKRGFLRQYKFPETSKKSSPEVNETSDIHHICLPTYKKLEVWYDDSIIPVELNEFKNTSSIHISNRYNSGPGNAPEARPYSEIYNMAVMSDSF